MKQKQKVDYIAELQSAHDRWEHIYKFGAQDPFWEDGCSLKLVRNHILYYRQKVEETMPDNLPEIYYKEVPHEVDTKYMARADEIREAAKVALAKYKADENYLYILQHLNDFRKKTQDKLSVNNVLGYVSGLEYYIKSDSLVNMRRHEYYERYLQSFADCARKMLELPPEHITKQLTIFGF